MNWNRESLHVIATQTSPAYKVCMCQVDGVKMFRPSFRGEFISGYKHRAKEAQDVCEHHHLINQEAKEDEHGAQEPA